MEENKIDDFGDDAIDVIASHIVVRGNKITNNHDIGDNNHNDAVQGWTQDGRTNRDILIEGNTIIASTNPAMQSPGNLQGISIFDGKWGDVRIVNNVVVVNSWHGIALYGDIRDAVVMNNTVMGSNAKVTTWIGLFELKTGEHPVNTVVRNNIAQTYILKSKGISNIDHNVIASDLRTLFVGFDVEHARYDLQLLRNSPARGAGNRDSFPPNDIVGRIRTPPIDAGAFAWSEARRP